MPAATLPTRSEYITPTGDFASFTVRAMRGAERYLQAACDRDGLTFWGEAAAAVLAAEMADPFPPRPAIPANLIARAPWFSAAARHSATFLVRLPPDDAARLCRLARRWQVKPEVAAAGLLHRAAIRGMQ